MYNPRTYERAMTFGTELRAVADRLVWRFVGSREKQTFFYRVAVHQEGLIRRLFARFDNLVEQAYLIGHDEGYREGHAEGETEARAQMSCHHESDEEWEARVSRGDKV